MITKVSVIQLISCYQITPSIESLFVARTLQKYHQCIRSLKNSAFLEDPTWMRQYFWTVRATWEPLTSHTFAPSPQTFQQQQLTLFLQNGIRRDKIYTDLTHTTKVNRLFSIDLRLEENQSKPIQKNKHQSTKKTNYNETT